ncbi:Hypothetical protein DHA2_15290 [Giardia duodenalis]|uniref:Uncharacterized protein n=1 Tax=Giardia intestinalis TaxID=5741 RepID=V6TM72_GIAIN|nr:Hypothetical protein DHA2_15290 [Giardia intestinalis]
MPQFSDTSQCQRWLFSSPEALQAARRAAYTSGPVLTNSLRYRQSEYPLKNAPLSFANYMISSQIINPYQTIALALCDLNNEKAKNLGRFVVACDFNEVIALSVFARQFITQGVRKYPEIQTAYNRMTQRFSAFNSDILHKSFLYYQVKTAEVLARRMTCFLVVSLIHPLSPLLISILLSFKIGSCDCFQRRETYVPRLYDSRYITDSPYLEEACGIRADDPVKDIKLRDLNKKTGELFSEIYRTMKKHELYLLQKLDFSVYCVLADDYIDDEFISSTLQSARIKLEHDPEIVITYNLIETELEFVLTATRLTDSYLLCEPEVIAVFCVVEGVLLYAQRHSISLNTTREDAYAAIASALALRDPQVGIKLALIRDTLFYFICESVPDVPEEIRNDAKRAADLIMPMKSVEYQIKDYLEFLRKYFSFKVVMLKID